MRRRNPYALSWTVRLLVGAAGVVVAAVALVVAAGPIDGLREFRRIAGCAERDACAADIPGLTREPARIRDRRVVPHVVTDGKSGVYVYPDLYEITWERAGGSRETRRVRQDTYDKARAGDPIVVRRWRGHTVGVVVAGMSEWYTPRLGGWLRTWLIVAWAGLVTALWSPSLGRPPGFWVSYAAISGLLVAILTPPAVAYGWGSHETTLLKILLPVNVLIAGTVSYAFKCLYD